MTTAATTLTISKVRAADIKAGPVNLEYKGAVYALTVNDDWGGQFAVVMPQDSTRHTGSLSHLLELVRTWDAAEAEEQAEAAAQGAARLCIAIARVAHAIAAASPSAPGYSESGTRETTAMTSRVGHDYIVTEGPAHNAAAYRATRLLHVQAVARALLAYELSLIPGRRVAACNLLPGMRVRTNLSHPARTILGVKAGPDADSVEVDILAHDGQRWTLVQDNCRMWDFLGTVHQSEQAQAAIHGFEAIREAQAAEFVKIEAPTLAIDAELYKGRVMSLEAKAERRIVANLLAYLEHHGWSLATVWDGEEDCPAANVREAMELVFNLDEARVYVKKPNAAGVNTFHSVVLVMGNASDIICDYTFTQGDPDGFAACMDAFNADDYT
ncbi:hypothetical protein [Pseudomonas phage Ppu-503]|nr:hypothetical protein [Pseudomonas phage Ppu-503]